jgi:hypothetical protein
MKAAIRKEIIVLCLCLFMAKGWAVEGANEFFRVEFVANKTTVASGEQVTYTITITNLRGLIPPGSLCEYYGKYQTFQAAAPQPSSVTQDTYGLEVCWRFGLAPGQTLQLTLHTVTQDLTGKTAIANNFRGGGMYLEFSIPVVQPGIPYVAEFNETAPPKVVRKDTNTILLQGFAAGGGLWKSFGVELGDEQGTPLADIEAKFAIKPPFAGVPTSGVLLPERVVTDSTGKAYSGLVMDSAGAYTVVASFPEFPELAPLEFPVQCYDLASIAGGLNSTDVQDVLEKALPLVSIVKSGNGQIGSKDKKLSLPLTVALCNRFGNPIISVNQVIEELQSWYNIHYPGQVASVQVEITMQANFQVTEGDATLANPVITTAVQTNAAGNTILSYPIGNSQSEYLAELTFGTNTVNPVAVRAWVTGTYSVLLTYAQGVDPTPIPKPASPYSVMPALFFFGPPEVYLVQETAPGSNTFERSDTVSTWDPFEMLFTKAPFFHIEAKLPFDEPATTTGGLEAFDACRLPLTTIDSAIGQVSLKDLPMTRTQTVGDRYSIYRTQQPIVYISRLKPNAETPPTLPSGFTYAQMPASGFSKPYAMADNKIAGNMDPKGIFFLVGDHKYYDKGKNTCFLVWNADDDNNNGQQDRYDDALPIQNENDLFPLHVGTFVGNQGNIKVTIEYPVGSNEIPIKIWEHSWKKADTELSNNHRYEANKSKQLYIEGIKGSERVGDVKVTFTLELNNTEMCKETICFTIIPLVALRAKTIYHPWDMANSRFLSSTVPPEKTSLFGVDWSPDGSYALAVGDQATVVQFTPDATTCPPGYELEMPIAWREQLDALELHEINSDFTLPDVTYAINAQSRFNRLDSIQWRPNSANTVVIVGGAWVKNGRFTSDHKEELSPSKEIKDLFLGTLSLVGGGCILSFDQTNFRRINPAPRVVYDMKELANHITPLGQPPNMYKFWKIGWRPDGDLAVILGEGPGKVFVYRPTSPNSFIADEITDFFRTPNARPPIEPSDLYTLLWNPYQSHFLLTGDPEHIDQYLDRNGNVINTIRFSTNWVLKFQGETAQPPAKFTNSVDSLVAEIAWDPYGNYALALGQHIYKANLNNQSVLEIPADPFYNNTLATIKYVKDGEQKQQTIAGLLEGICWHSSKKYAIITGGTPADTIFTGNQFWREGGIPGEAIPKMDPYHQLFIYDAESNQVFPVRFPLKNSPLRRACWRPGGGEQFAVTIIRYRQ